MSKWRRLQKPDPKLKCTWSESFLCIDCGLDTQPGTPPRAEAERIGAARVKAGKKWAVQCRFNSRSETYIVHDHIWKRAGMEAYGGCLCIGCLEKRIGRELTPTDFDADHPFNNYTPGTPRLLQRQGRYDPLGESEDVA